MTEVTFQKFVECKESHELEQIKEEILNGGYRSLYRFIGEFREAIKTYDDKDKDLMEHAVEKARQVFPNPGSISPSWQNIWGDFSQICKIKNEVFSQIPEQTRDGEWQVLMDNPYTHQDVVCYPGLSFLEATYLYSYFRISLNKNEVIRIQKVQTLISDHGD